MPNFFDCLNEQKINFYARLLAIYTKICYHIKVFLMVAKCYKKF